MSFIATNIDLVDWKNQEENIGLTPWQPRALSHGEWPPNYMGVYAWRMKQLKALRADAKLLDHAKRYYSTRPAEFIIHWMDTYNPRKEKDKWIPFVFFSRQLDFIQFLEGCRKAQENGLVEKCRDAGVTWLACGYSVHSWLFIKSDAIGWGSRKQDLVDKLGNPDSIFEKMRLILARLPDVWRPKGYDPSKHATFMRFVNPDNRSVIMGEAGDNIGRGGRTSIYFKDESAHYERPEKIEAALGDNTNVQIDISSVNGLGNVFHRKREAGIDWIPGTEPQRGFTRVFVFDWSHHPEKTQIWYDERRAKFEREGMLHLFAQEVERNYSAAIQNTLIPYEWIHAAVDAHKLMRWKDAQGRARIGYEPADNWMAGLDVADGGIDRNALSIRQDIVLRSVEEWGERDTGVTARKTIERVRQYPRIRVMYDNIGVGSGIKSEINRLKDENLATVQFVGWNAGATVLDPYDRLIPDDDTSPLNRDMFQNMKAQAWWSVRSRFYKTFQHITKGVDYPIDEMISIDSTIPLLLQLKKELAQPTKGESSSLKTMINKKPEGTKSPNLADSVIQAFFPIDEQGVAITGRVGGG